MSKQAMVCLISKEAMANVLPVLEYKPDMVFLAATNEQVRNAGYLKEFFEKKGIPAEIVSGMSAYQPEPNKIVITELFAKYPDYTFTLNSTGGTKIMSIAAYEAFSSTGMKVIYCNTPGREIMMLPEGKVDRKLNVELTTEEYLTAYGYSIDDRKAGNNPEQYKKLYEHLLQGPEMKDFVSLIRFFRKSKKLLYAGMSISSANKRFILEKREGEYVLSWKGGNQVTFSEFRFINGDWLEGFIHYFMQKNKISSMRSVHIISPEGNLNEIDLLFVRNSVLHLVSAKTGEFSKLDLFELQGLQLLAGGIMAKPVILHVGQIGQADAKRAKEMRIDSVSVFELHKLL